MRSRIIIRYVGVALIMVAMMMAVSALVAIINGYDDSASPLILSSFITLISGIFPMIFVRAERNIEPQEGVAIVVLSWIVCCLFGMIPYVCYGSEFTLVNAFFESVSGFTTTGASILDNIEGIPAGLLFWRVSTSWVGGLGIVSFFSLIIPRSIDTRSVLSNVEISDITRSQSSKHGKSCVRTILTVYMILTAACALSLRLAGLGWFDAVTDAMSTCSTCGFCVRNASIASYGNVSVEIIILFFMATSGVSFVFLSTLAISSSSGRRRISTATMSFFSFLAAATLLVTLDLSRTCHIPLPESLRLAAFQVCSITTTTGFATADTTVWPSSSIFVLLIASIICGCSGSTSGGIKMDRAVLIYRYIKDGFKTVIHPHRYVGTRLDGRIVSNRYASEAMKFVLVYASLILIGSMVNTLFGLDIKTGVSASIACLGNVGPGFGGVGSMGNYAGLPSILKLNSAALMIAGRLEIFPILSFIGLSFSHR